MSLRSRSLFSFILISNNSHWIFVLSHKPIMSIYTRSYSLEFCEADSRSFIHDVSSKQDIVSRVLPPFDRYYFHLNVFMINIHTTDELEQEIPFHDRPFDSVSFYK